MTTIGNKIYQGDCLEIMKSLPDNSIDLVLSDPPHGVTACSWDNVIDIDLMWEQLKRISKPTSPIVINTSEPYGSRLVVSNEKMYKYYWIWEKNKATNFLNANRQPLRILEKWLVFYSKQCVYNPQKTHGHKPVNSFTKNTGDGSTVGKTRDGYSGGGQTDRFPTNIIKLPVVNNDNSNGDKHYPTQKPVELLEYFIKTYTDEGDTVLDFAMGAGSTCVACDNTKRLYVGIELEEVGFGISKSRLENYNN